MVSFPFPTVDGARLREQSNCLNIVIVEDHDAMREVMMEILSSHGHHVRGMASAEEFSEAVGTDLPVDLLILDLNLPGEDGLSLSRRYRAEHPLVGIIMVSARQRVDDKVKGYDSGADIYLQKPVANDELIAAIQSMSRRLLQPVNSMETLQAKHFTLDPASLLLSGPKGASILTDVEALILTSMVRRPGQRIDISELLLLLNQDPESYSKAALEVRMVRLRKKLQFVGADKLCIRAIRLKGYQLGVVVKLV